MELFPPGEKADEKRLETLFIQSLGGRVPCTSTVRASQIQAIWTRVRVLQHESKCLLPHGEPARSPKSFSLPLSRLPLLKLCSCFHPADLPCLQSISQAIPRPGFVACTSPLRPLCSPRADSCPLLGRISWSLTALGACCITACFVT